MIVICKSQAKTTSELASSNATNALLQNYFKSNLVFKSFIPVNHEIIKLINLKLTFFFFLYV